MQVNAAVDVFVQFFITGGDKGELSGTCLLIEAQFHIAGGNHALHRPHAEIEEPRIQYFRQFQGGKIVLDKHDFIFLHRDFPRRLQSPQQHIGVFFKIIFGKHSFSPFVY